MSFIYLGIYWNNHHHMMQAVDKISGPILRANLHLLFWLSLIPFVTGWVGENYFESLPTAIYGFVLLASALAFVVLQNMMIAKQGKDSKLARAVGADWKGKFSILCYVAAIPLAFVNQWVAVGLYVLVAMMWLVPDTRIERVLSEEQ